VWNQITTKFLLAAIALGLWANVASTLYGNHQLVRTIQRSAYDDTQVAAAIERLDTRLSELPIQLTK
jgi:hypothetical protein